ncbi:MAG: SDR family NAD(P)-dependent oxidoreductase [Novosphingobium sp.]|nr:SDR family NAD(P)-dependent oxidoreductase [Novosphingobium sp.]MCP5403317.1 SDR family NAD(P)-dependent oxidoreductase [Novosphingobium sp.]
MATAGPRVAVVTGASAGIGRQAAKELAGQGWRVIATGRNPERCAAAETEIRAASATGDAAFICADLSLMADVARLAREIAGMTDRVDLLLNNAGGMPSHFEMTAEGYEANFAGNHLGPFLLTERLLPLLRKAAGDAPEGSVRIINTSSDASEMIETLNLDDMQNLDTYSNGLAYCSSKLANVLHARGLATRLADDGIIAHSLHPGTVDSNFFDDLDEQTRAYTQTLEKMTVEQGADTLVWLATGDEPGRSSGGYWHERRPRKPNPLIDDDAFIARFWEESERLVARAGV